MNYAPLLLSRPPVSDSTIHWVIVDSCPKSCLLSERLSSAALMLALHLFGAAQWREMRLVYVPRPGMHHSPSHSSFPCQ
jgi:hypothetical protein